ncbi:MAG TPA: M4 family metallopeptidase [Frankiaceae bacterium]|nr:M4 family metallopeptidase [Frankiaceae bacterium]
MSQRNPLQCILPPHIVSNLARNGSEAQRARAIEHLQMDHTVRSARLNQSLMRVAARPRRVTGGSATTPTAQRTIYDAKNAETQPPTGTLVRSEGQAAVKDEAVDEAYDGLGATFDFYLDAYDRNSIDDEGLPLKAFVHFGSKYDNAFWDGSEMVFGDGDGDLFNRFTISVDVIGHELTHGVTEDEAGLVYSNQSGALNESISDVFGSLVKQYLKKQTAEQADWLIGEGLFTANVQGRALRDMANPGTAYDDDVLGKDPQPANMTDYQQTTQDNGGVHINSGIPNRAFYLAATHLGGNAWEKAGQIWYDTIRDPRLRSSARFVSFARLTVRNALIAFDADASSAVKDAWNTVGVKV